MGCRAFLIIQKQLEGGVINGHALINQRNIVSLRKVIKETAQHTKKEK